MSDKIEFKVEGFEECVKLLSDKLRKETLWSASQMLTSLAMKAKGLVVNEMKAVFDRPTPYTLNSIIVRPASRSNLRAIVQIKDQATKGTAPIKYMSPEVYGGVRGQKRSERLLAKIGVIGSNEYLVPFKAPRDQYGNVSAGLIQRVLSGLQAQADPNQDSPAKGQGYKGTRKGRSQPLKYFAVQRNNKTTIFERSARRAVPLFVAEKKLNYKKRLSFHETVTKVLGSAQEEFKSFLGKFGW